MKIAISTTSFGVFDQTPLNLLKSCGLSIVLNDKKRVLSESEVIELLQGCVGLIAGTEPLTAKVMKTSGLKVISRLGVGLNSVDVQAAKDLNIKVFTTTSPSQAVAELTLGLALSLLRNIVQGHTHIKAGHWQKQGGFLLQGKKVGIIGLGQIGLKVANIFNFMGADIAYFDINKKAENYPYMPLEQLLKWANIITLHCPLGTSPLLGAKQLELMQGKWLINTARGGLIDEQALYEHLHSGHILGAALDVFENEPYSGPLKTLENIILSPHCASFAKEERIKMEMQAANNLITSLGLSCQ